MYARLVLMIQTRAVQVHNTRLARAMTHPPMEVCQRILLRQLDALLEMRVN